MARDHARILLRIWADPEFRALERGAQQLYFMLLSDGGINNAGVVPLQARRWANCSSDGTEASIRDDLDALAAGRFVIADHDTEEVLVRSFIRNDGVAKQPNTLKNAAVTARSTQSPEIRRVLAGELRRVRPAHTGSEQARLAVTELDETLAMFGPHEPPPNPSGDPSSNPSENPSNGAVDVAQSKDTANPSGMGFLGTPRGRGGGRVRGEGSSSERGCFRSPPDSGDPKRGTRLPDDFTITAELADWAARETPHIDVATETEKFCDYWRAKTGKDATKLDWVATWRNWMRNARDRYGSNHTTAVSRLPMSETRAQDRINELHRIADAGLAAAEAGLSFEWPTPPPDGERDGLSRKDWTVRYGKWWITEHRDALLAGMIRRPA